jgi:hypothetical protein
MQRDPPRAQLDVTPAFRPISGLASNQIPTKRLCAPARAGLDLRDRMVAEGGVSSESAEIVKAVVR